MTLTITSLASTGWCQSENSAINNDAEAQNKLDSQLKDSKFDKTEFLIILDKIAELRSSLNYSNQHDFPDYPSSIDQKSLDQYYSELSNVYQNTKILNVLNESDEEKIRVLELQVKEELIQLNLLNAQNIPGKPSPINLTFWKMYLTKLKAYKNDLILDHQK